MMKTRYKIAIWTVVAVTGSAMLGGSLWVWHIGLLVGKLLIRLLFTLALAVVLFILAYALIIGGLFWILIS